MTIEFTSLLSDDAELPFDLIEQIELDDGDLDETDDELLARWLRQNA